MVLKILLISLAGLAADVWFIKTEYAGKMAKATLLKGIASFFFVVLGIVCYAAQKTDFGRLVLIGLILAFLSGHFLYIAALIGRSPAIILPALIATAVLSALAIPPLMKRITAPSAGLKIFGYVYLVVVIAMFSCAAALLVTLGAGALTLVFTLGALLFVVSDFIMIYYSFGKKIKPLRAINLLCYYVGQLMIAVCILLA